MFVTSRLVVEDGNILPRRAAFVGPNRSLDEASNSGAVNVNRLNVN